MPADCIVIGGSGFIGRAVVSELVAQGQRVKVLGRRAPSDVSLPDGCHYFQADFAQPGVLESHLHSGCSVICLAYATTPSTSYEDPVRDILENLPPAVRLFEIAHRMGVSKVVICSSGGATYGESHEPAISESHSLRPISPYGITKCAIDLYAHMYYSTKNLPVVVVRPANAYGELQRHGRGQGFLAEAIHLISSGLPVPLYGGGSAVRDYIHVEDVARGIVAALQHGRDGESYNIGTGRGTTTGKLVELLALLAAEQGLSVSTSILPQRGFDVSVNVLESSKLAAVSSWRPNITLKEGLRRVWDHKSRNISEQIT